MNAAHAIKHIPVTSNPHFAARKKNSFAEKIERFFYQHRQHLVWLHMVMFVFFLSLIVIPLFLPESIYGDTWWNNFSEFSKFLIWGLWFPLVFISVLFTGRSWCGILCPMGAASEWMNKIGLKRPIPGWLRWQGTPILSFMLITILGQTVDVRDQATAMAEIFGGTLVLALLIGFLYGRGKQRAWCRHACPIGLLLGVFARLGIVEFANKLKTIGNDSYSEKGICPTMIAVNDKKESRHCIQCFRCVKPSSKGGLFLRFRKPGEEIENIQQYNPNLAEVWFIFLSTGVSLGGFLWLILPSYQNIRQIIGEFFVKLGWYGLLDTGPAWLMSVHPAQAQSYTWLDFMMIIGFMLFYMLAAATVLTIANYISTLFVRRINQEMNKLTIFTALAYQFAPIAMMSIIIGLGDQLFQGLLTLGFSAQSLMIIKTSLLVGSLLWSCYLGFTLLKNLNLNLRQCLIALCPAIIAGVIIMLAWWPAVFGVDFSLLENYRATAVIVN